MTTSLNLYQYSNIVIDYSVMFAELDDWLVEQLVNNDRVWVNPTFVCDCHHFSKNVSAKIKNTYQTNANLFEYVSSRVCNMWGVVDTFNLARWFSTNHGSTIVIAANFSLEDRIIFSGLNVDIYCWYQNRIIKHQSFANEQSERQIDKNKDPLPFYETKAGNYVYSNMGAYILDGDPNDIGRGAEASIYEVRNNPNLLAKIYGLDMEAPT